MMLRRVRVRTPLCAIFLCVVACANDPATLDGPSNPADGSTSSPNSTSSTSNGGYDASVERDAAGSVDKPRDAGAQPVADASDKPTPAKDAGAGDTDSGQPQPGDAGPGSASDAGGSKPEPQSCGGKANMWKAGDTNGSIMVGGLKRTYILHVPVSYKGDQPVPLLLDFHPMIFGTAASQRRSSGYAEIADKEGFIVAYADGIDNAWNLGPCCTKSRDVDDFGLALALVERFKSEGCIDAKRVYAAGYSNGGGLSHYLACKSANVFAAVSPAAFDLIEEVKCEPSRPISVVSFRGTGDSIVPYSGGASTPPTAYPLTPIHFLGALGTFKKWAEVDGCTGEPTTGTGDAKVAWPMLKKYTLP